MSQILTKLLTELLSSGEDSWKDASPDLYCMLCLLIVTQRVFLSALGFLGPFKGKNTSFLRALPPVRVLLACHQAGGHT